jgi:hypothetical protein
MQYNPDIWTIAKRRKSRIQSVDIQFLRSIEGKQEGIEL